MDVSGGQAISPTFKGQELTLQGGTDGLSRNLVRNYCCSMRSKPERRSSNPLTMKRTELPFQLTYDSSNTQLLTSSSNHKLQQFNLLFFRLFFFFWEGRAGSVGKLSNTRILPPSLRRKMFLTSPNNSLSSRFIPFLMVSLSLCPFSRS